MKRIISIFFVISLLWACSQPPVHENYNASLKLLQSVAWFQKSAEMKTAYQQAYEFALLKLEKNLANTDTTTKPAAVVLDIDETVLDNSPFEVNCIQTGRNFTPELWNEWTQKAEAKALPGALQFIQTAQAKGVKVVLISNRSTSQLAATLSNLQKEGFVGFTEENVLLKTDSSDKTSRRQKVEETYQVLLFVGDNLTDFKEIYRDRSQNFGFGLVDSTWQELREKFIQLPNPMYGDWTDELEEHTKNPRVIDSLEIGKLDGYAK